MVSVSKKRFKRAVKRNRVKRQIREAYRLNKHCLLSNMEERNSSLLIAFLYIDKELAPSNSVHKAMTKALNKLSQL
jgi:ribonuclease P protein component